jgi:ribosomal subunit interface protein
MDIPLQISFRNLDASEAVEAKIREKVDKLEQFFGHIVSCRVVVERINKQHHQGNLYNIRIDLAVPGHEIAVTGVGPKNHAHEDIYVALRDAFNATSRRLEDIARKFRGDTKLHEAAILGKVTRIFPGDGYGFIETSDGREVYFHANSVDDGAFNKLEPGFEVRLLVGENESLKGPQAMKVTPRGQHRLAG